MPEQSISEQAEEVEELNDLGQQGWRLKRLKNWHLKAIELSLQGLSNKEVAEQCGRHPQTMSLLINQPLFQEELSKRRQQQNRQTDTVVVRQALSITQKLEDAQHIALDVMIGCLDDEDARTRIVASKDILDRAGVGKNQQGVQISATVSPEAMLVLVAALKESRSLREAASAT